MQIRNYFIDLFVDLSRLIAPNSTLRGQVKGRLAVNYPDIHSIRKRKVAFTITRVVTSKRFSLLFPFVILSALFSLCFTHMFNGTAFTIINFLTLSKTDSKSLITDSLTTVATLFSISLVVIGFLFESIRDKIQKNYEELFRASNLYFVFSFCVTSIIFLLVITLLKHTVKDYILANMATLSLYISIGVVIFIASLFYKAIKFFDVDKIRVLTSAYLLSSAEHHLLDEIEILESKRIIHDVFTFYNFQQATMWESFPDDITTINLYNEKDAYLKDIQIKLLRFGLKKLRGDVASFSSWYHPIYHNYQADKSHTIIVVQPDIPVSKFCKYLIPSCYSFRKKSGLSQEFSREKENLVQRLNKLSKDSNADISSAVADIENLYSLYFKSRRND